VDSAVAVTGEGAPYDGLRAILSAVWAVADGTARAEPKKAASRARRPLPKPAPKAESIKIDAALRKVGLGK
jgi:hypothetical protein